MITIRAPARSASVMALVMALVIIDYNPRTHLGAASALSIYAPSAAVQLQFSHPFGVRRVVKYTKRLILITILAPARSASKLFFMRQD